MAELVRGGEMDFPAGGMVFAMDQSRASFASVCGVPEMVSPGESARSYSGSRAANDGTDGLGGGYRCEPAAI